MSIVQAQLISILSPPLPNEVVENIIKEYLSIKINLVLAHYSPTELNGGRFAECIIRLVQSLDNPPYTPFGHHLNNVDQIIRRAEGNSLLPDSMRFYIPRLARILLDIRNRRDVAHVGGEVNPNYSDSLFVSQVSDWIITEIIRVYYNCSIDVSKKIVENISQVHVPVIFNSNGFLKVQNSSLTVKSKVLILLYYRKPERTSLADLIKWTKYKNSTQFKDTIISSLDNEALIHFEDNYCVLTPKGVLYVEKNFNLEITI